jgi:hypothetical protein
VICFELVVSKSEAVQSRQFGARSRVQSLVRTALKDKSLLLYIKKTMKETERGREPTTTT